MRTKLSYGLLAVTLIWLLVESPSPITVSWMKVDSQDPGAIPRFALLVGVWFVLLLAVLIPGKRFTRFHKTLCGVGLAALLVALLENTFRSHNVDEIITLLVSYEVSLGSSQYSDFFHIYHPLLYFLWSPMMAWFEGDLNVLFAGKILALGNLAALILVLHKLSQKVEGSLLYTLVALGCIQPFTFTMTELRPDPFAALFSLLSLALLAYQRPALAGVALGVGFAFHQKAALWGTVLLLCYLATRPKAAEVARFVGATVLVSLAVPLWALTDGIFPEYFRCAFGYTFQYAGNQTGTGLVKSYSMILAGQILKQCFPFALACLGGVYLSARAKDQTSVLVATFGPLLFLVVLFLKFLYPQYTIVCLPILALLASRGLRSLEDFESPGFAPKIPCLVVLMAVLVALSQWAARPPLGEIKKLHQETLERVPADETYWGYGLGGLSHHPVYRRCPSHYIYVKEFARPYFERSGIVPYEHPPELIRPKAAPPRVIVGDENVIERCLADLESRGYKYREIGPSYFILVDPEEEQSPSEE